MSVKCLTCGFELTPKKHCVHWSPDVPISFAAPSNAASRRKRDRKDKLDLVLAQATMLHGDAAIKAWWTLCRELGQMTHPEAPMPRFNTLLHAVWIAASNDQT